MKINGLQVDTKKIAVGLYDIICEKDEQALVAFGMIPKWIMDLLEKQLREKIIRCACEQMRFTPEEIKSILELDGLGMLVSSETTASGFSEQMIRDTIAPIVKQVATDIYGVASERGMMVV